ncbi:hypothetical protein [Desulfatibacillum aliphaticivorans]|uniref:hypothetical protein n=1 Tax=Desulfatibacillum aliphaticivorans TaxID=218208 RepID=UPI0005C20CD7|nr:hypothetical protein [Desulfatibacillum aliphaticivorans]
MMIAKQRNHPGKGRSALKTGPQAGTQCHYGLALEYSFLFERNLLKKAPLKLVLHACKTN